MTKDEAVKALLEMTGNSDNEVVHDTADEILLAYLHDNGGEDVARAYDTLRRAVPFWYA